MSNYKYDFIAFIGRFEPAHIGHIEVIKHALTLSENVVILIGSSNQPRTPKNPWTFDERVDMISKALALEFPADDLTECLQFFPVHDQKYNDQKWAAGVQHSVSAATFNWTRKDRKEPKVALIGHTKDESSYYLKMFPQWDLIEHEMNEKVNATDLRTILFEGKNIKFLQGVLPKPVYEAVEQFVETPEFKTLQHEYDVIKKYKKAWEAAPYAPIFVTVDAIVVQSGHVLLVQRDAAPGEGLMALVGGFLNQDEYIEDGMIRELKEETKIKVPPAVLKGNIKQRKVYDRPDRSSRGRTITHAFLIELPPGPLPSVKGSDDARDARWVKFTDIREDQMFEDHYHVIMDMLGKM